MPLLDTQSRCDDIHIQHELRFSHCIMRFIQFWINMADKEIKVHWRVIQMIYHVTQMANNDRLVQSACLFYDNALCNEKE